MKVLQYIALSICLFLSFQVKAQEEISLKSADTTKAIINPNAYAHDVFLELVENFVTPSEYYGLYLDQSTTEAGSEALLFSATSWGGSTYGPQYLITGIYNISGK